jgi:hypothetical protein
VFYPLALAASLFSTQGVLPFKPNLAYFIYVLVILAALLVVTLIVCSNWTLWFQSIVNYLTVELTLPKTIVENDEHLGGEETRDSNTSPRALKRTQQNLLSRRLRKADFCTPGDIEEGTEKGRAI